MSKRQKNEWEESDEEEEGQVDSENSNDEESEESGSDREYGSKQEDSSSGESSDGDHEYTEGSSKKRKRADEKPTRKSRRSTRKARATRSKAKADSSRPRQGPASPEDGELSSSGGSESEFEDPFEEDLTLKNDPEDRIRLSQMGETKREAVLYERTLARAEAKEKWEFRQKVRMEHKQRRHQSRKVDHRPRRSSSKRDGRERALLQISARRETMKKRDEEREQDLGRGSPSAPSPIDRDAALPSSEPSAAATPASKPTHAHPLRERIRMEFLHGAAATPQLSDRATDHFATPAHPPEPEPEPEVDLGFTVHDIQSCRVTRDNLDRWMNEPFFEDLMKGLWVRIGVGSKKMADGTDKSVYRMAQIVGFSTSATGYTMPSGRRTQKKLVLKHGITSSDFRMPFVSNSRITQEEFDKWVVNMRRAGAEYPGAEDFEMWQKQLHKALNYVYSNAEVEQIVGEKKKKGGRVNLVAQQEVLRRKISALQEQESLSASQQQELAQAQAGLEAINKQETGKREADDQRLVREKLARERTKHLETQEIMELSAARQRRSETNRTGGEKMDPFSRRVTKPTVMWQTGRKRKTEPLPQAAADGDSQPSAVEPSPDKVNPSAAPAEKTEAAPSKSTPPRPTLGATAAGAGQRAAPVTAGTGALGSLAALRPEDQERLRALRAKQQARMQAEEGGASASTSTSRSAPSAAPRATGGLGVTPGRGLGLGPSPASVSAATTTPRVPLDHSDSLALMHEDIDLGLDFDLALPGPAAIPLSLAPPPKRP